MKLELKKKLLSILAFIGLIWAVYLINIPFALTQWNLTQYGLKPHTLSGLIGIFSMPFLHDGIQHLLGNTVPLTVLLIMLAFTRQNPRRIVVCLTIISGSMLWIIGWGNKNHVGASALIYALAVYLIAVGYYERKVQSAVVAILVIVLYGTLFWGMLPTASGVSWEGHLMGAIAGGVFAFWTVGRSRSKNDDVSSIANPAPP
ncbi:MAG TPA: rhomboid family intramembrane serine protease [Planctomycetaceae bacterium]|nr:rhomboid family intramembrane serine protease [Planctomycetaceae bacterium]